MTTRHIITALLLLTLSVCFQPAMGQKFYASFHPIYTLNADSGDYFFEHNEYELAIPYFERALYIENHGMRAKLRLTQCYFEKGDFTRGNKWLLLAASQNWENLLGMDNSNLQDLQQFQQYVAWAQFNRIVQQRKSSLNADLMDIVEEIYLFDQGIRTQSLLPSDYENSRFHPPGISDSQVDSINLVKMVEIFERYGYPGKDLVGKELHRTGFLVLQHANSRVDLQEKYHPLLQEAVIDFQTGKSTIAYLNDRIKVNKGACQDFGTQIGYNVEKESYYLHPVTDIKTLNERRQEYHMRPIDTYLHEWNLTVTKADKCPQ